MAYTIHARVLQTDPNNWFSIVEKATFSSSTWSEADGTLHSLAMEGSGTSGMLRFKNGATGEYFLVALGIHNYKRWCDIVVDAPSKDTGVAINPTYYSDAAGNRNEMLWKQLAHLERTTAKGWKITVDYYKEDGNTLYATINISKA